MRNTFLSFSPPLIGQEELDEVLDTLRSDWITTGPKTKRFEQEFAQFIGAPAALAVSSATDAMLVGLAALGIGAGDEVITTPMTFCSTVHVIEHLGARPVLVDVEPDTLNIDPAQVERAITPRTRAIMPVHLYGHPCEMDALLDLAAKNHLHVLEDAAHALPAKYKGRMIGSPPTPTSNIQSPTSNLTAFSFYATKNLTTAEGGMLTGAPDLIEKARVWSLHGMSRDAYKRYSAEGSWFYEVILPGFKCNMTDIQASLGLQQLKKLPRFQERRREIVRRYNEAFAQLEELQTPIERPEVEHAWHLYVLRLNLERFPAIRKPVLSLSKDPKPVVSEAEPSEIRNRFIEELKNANIGTSVHFIPVHLHPYYRDKYGFKPTDFPIAYREYQRIISLPLYPRMNDQDVADVIEAVARIVKKSRR